MKRILVCSLAGLAVLLWLPACETQEEVTTTTTTTDETRAVHPSGMTTETTRTTRY